MNPRLKWHLAKYINFNSPAHLDIELSTKCNLNCEFCFRKEYKYPAKDMNLHLAYQILKQAKKIKIPSIKFNWRGEALCHSDWAEIIMFAKTNGFYTMLNTALADNYQDASLDALAWIVDNLKISFDSSSARTYNEIRKGADFFKTLVNLDRLIEYRKQYNMPKVILNRRTTNISEPDEAFKEFFGDEVDYDIRPAMERNQQKIYKEGLRNRARKYCGQPTQRMVIDVDGNVWACCCSYTREDALLFGNVKDRTLKQIWDGAKRSALFKELKHNIFLNDTCKNCTSKEGYIKSN